MKNSSEILVSKAEGSEHGGGNLKRKHAAPEQSNEPDNDDKRNKSTAFANAIERSLSKSKREPKKVQGKSASCVIEWPETFRLLEKTHKALNLVYTFCCTRKHLATTFETLKSTVESHIKRALTAEDVASIVALRPEGIRFEYVDELMLQLDAKGSERDDTFKPSKSRRSQAPAHDASVGGSTGSESLDDCHNRELNAAPREVLFFEFIDGDLKRQVLDRKTNEPVKPSRRLRDEQLKMPVYGQKQMTELIERRNQRFANAVNIFLNKCTKEATDPNLMLRHIAQDYLPTPSAANDRYEMELARQDIPAEIPKERKSIPEIVQELKESPWYTGQIVPDGHRVFESQEAIYGDLEFLLTQNLVNALYNAKDITRFYAHQAEALNFLHRGHNVVVATSTSSGKSLIYQLPILHELENDLGSRAMYIFPTKALAQDQKRSLKEMLAYMTGLEETLVETFDGDTPMSERHQIREGASIIFTNPDMLHVTILPQEERWRSFLKNLKYVVGMAHLRIGDDPSS